MLEYHNTEEMQESQKAAAQKLMDELEEGRRSGESEGWVSSDEARAHIELKKAQKQH